MHPFLFFSEHALLLGAVCLGLSVSNSPAGTPYRLENEHLRLEVDSGGKLVTLVNRHSGHNYAGGGALWRLYFQRGPELDIEAAPGPEQPDIRTSGNRLEIDYPGAVSGGKRLRIAVHVTAELRGEELYWTQRIDNREPGVTVRESHFPLVGGLQTRNGQALITSALGGEKTADITAELKSTPKKYKASEFLFLSKTVNYPFPAANNCFTFADKDEGLYFGCHIAPAERTLQQFRLYPGGRLEAGFVRFLDLAGGGQRELGPFVISPYNGDWHVAARKYRAWADTWFSHAPAPQWVRRMNGWQRIIMQHQYGEVNYSFAQMPQIQADGERSGIDTLFMFGWHRGGHDNNYPDYEPDPRLGSLPDMIAGVDGFNRKGGHVILYANGRLIDHNSEFYRDGGTRLSIKDFFGNQLCESYRFNGPGNYVSEFATRTFSPACPSSPEWYAVLQGLADKALAWHCHSIFLDQYGTTEYPCCDPAHPHPPHWMGTAQAKADNLRRLRSYLRGKAPDMAIGIELLTDVTAQYADYVHNITGATDVNPGWEKSGAKPRGKGFVEWFRYAFPEVILSDREIRDDTDIERRVNHAVLLGLRSDVEIYRCRRTIAETPRYAAYLAEIDALRQKYATLLLEGRYVDTDGISWDNAEIDARAFVNGTRTAVVLTQSHLKGAVTRLHTPGRLVDQAAVGGGRATAWKEGVTVTLPKNALAVLVFENEAAR